MEFEYNKAKENGTLEAFCRFHELDNFEEKLKLPLIDFCVVMFQKVRDKQEQYLKELMKMTTVTIIESELLKNGNAKVMLEMISPKPDGTYFKQKKDLILSNRDGKWLALREF